MTPGPGANSRTGTRPVAARHPAARIALAACLAAAGCGGPALRLPKDDPRYDFELGRREFERRHYVDAQTHLKRFLSLQPGNAVADSAQFLVGRSLLESKAYAEAAVEFAILPREYPRSELRDDAAFHECLSYHRQMRPPQFDPTFASRASACWSEFLLRYPDSASAGQVAERQRDIADRLAEKEFRIGVLFAKLKKPAAARIYLEGLVQQYPETRWVPACLYWIGRSQELQGEPAAAVASYRQLLSRFPQDEAAGDARSRLAELARRHPDVAGGVENAAPPEP